MAGRAKAHTAAATDRPTNPAKEDAELSKGLKARRRRRTEGRKEGRHFIAIVAVGDSTQGDFLSRLAGYMKRKEQPHPHPHPLPHLYPTLVADGRPACLSFDRAPFLP